MEYQGGHFQYSGSFKVAHPTTSNNIPQMRSAGYQAPFIAGGNQNAYYLGRPSNATVSNQMKFRR